MIKSELANQLKRYKPDLERRWGVKSIGFFDDYIDHHHTANCEINILVEFHEPLGWRFFEMKEWLEKKLFIRIDICTPKSLKPALKEEILNQTTFV
ncbi:MAG: nucleotidyltransferase family protein [Flavobacteriales bacterium]